MCYIFSTVKKYVWCFVFIVLVSLVVTRQHEYQTANSASDASGACNATLSGSDAEPSKANGRKANGNAPSGDFFYLVFGWPAGITTCGLFLTFLAIADQAVATRRSVEATHRGIEIGQTKERPKLLIEPFDLNPKMGSVPIAAFNVTNVGLSTAFVGTALYQIRILPSDTIPTGEQDFQQMYIYDRILESKETTTQDVRLRLDKKRLYGPEQVVHLDGMIFFTDHFEDTRKKEFHFVWIEFGASVFFPHQQRNVTGYWESKIDQTERLVGVAPTWWEVQRGRIKEFSVWAGKLSEIDED